MTVYLQYDPNVIYQTYAFLMFQDPRLLGDAYLTTGQQYTRVGNGVESPTYIQLENAAVSSITRGGGGYSSGIYSPPGPYRQDYLGNSASDIYSMKAPSR